MICGVKGDVRRWKREGFKGIQSLANRYAIALVSAIR